MSARRPRWALAMGLYLLGIFMGAIDTGIVTPARTIISDDLGVSEQLGIWMITIYTLSYAAAIPVLGKLADRLGRKPVYLFAIALFGVGSLLCGLAQDVGSFGISAVERVDAEYAGFTSPGTEVDPFLAVTSTQFFPGQPPPFPPPPYFAVSAVRVPLTEFDDVVFHRTVVAAP